MLPARVTPVVLTQLVATWIFYERHWETMTRRLGFSVAAEIAMVVDGLHHAPDDKARARILDETARVADLVISVEPGAHLARVAHPETSMVERTLGLAIAERVRLPYTINSRLSREWYEIRVQLPEGVLRVLAPERRLFSPTTYIFILWMVGSALVLFAIAIVFMRNQIRSIRRLAVAADSFGKGRDVPDFRPEGAAEPEQPGDGETYWFQLPPVTWIALVSATDCALKIGPPEIEAKVGVEFAPGGA